MADKRMHVKRYCFQSLFVSEQMALPSQIRAIKVTYYSFDGLWQLNIKLFWKIFQEDFLFYPYDPTSKFRELGINFDSGRKLMGIN